MDLAVAILQVLAGLAAVLAVGLALLTLRDAQAERQEDRDWRREERRERWLEQLQDVAVMVEQIIATFPNMQSAERERIRLRLEVRLRGIRWVPLEKTRELAGMENSEHWAPKNEGLAQEAKKELDATFKRIFERGAP